ncbi:Cupin domain-containing protein [Cladophialophora immunda]|nr:Cupin domain-containing protein [Cladophialophora immunda]
MTTLNEHSRTNGIHDKPAAAAAAEEEEMQDFYRSLPSKHVEPLWLKLDKFVPPFPNPSATPAIWRFQEILPSLMEAGRIVPVEEAERRVLMLVNPGMSAPHTTDTIYGGLQLVLPGEVAPAHRHSAFALRFVIESGAGAYTAVEGEKIAMRRGDVILTPSWQWHDHGNEGAGPVIWLDGLDLPLFGAVPLNFGNPYPQPRYPSTPVARCTSQFPWPPVENALTAAGGKYARYDYRHADGSHLSRTLSVQAERVPPGASSPETQETASFVYHVVEGEGFSTILAPGETAARKIEWTARDTFAVPAWSKVTHTNASREGKAAFLVAINDRPMVESLGLMRNAATFTGRID